MESREMVRLNRAVRLFVSSTFSDMETERRVLVERVFPQVREWCHARGVSFTEIDLRWGITDEHARAGRVLPICLAEIDACHPFFLGLLGGRYGSGANSFQPDLLADHPWLAGLEHRSYTELEFIRALWSQHSGDLIALVYERDPAADPRPEVVGSETAMRLAEFKAKIRSSGIMRHRECYRTADELGQWVLKDLVSAVEQIFPEQAPPSVAERERHTQMRLRWLRGRRFIGPQEMLDQLDAHAMGAGPPSLLVSAPAGMGKSTLLGVWTVLASAEFTPSLYLTHALVARLRRWWGLNQPTVQSSVTGRLAAVVWCGVGGSPQASSFAGIVRHICAELDERLSPTLAQSIEPGKLPLLLGDVLLAAAAKGRVVVVLDGLDHLAESEASRLIASLPDSLPDTLRLIVSAGPGEIADRLRERGFTELRIPAWGEEERRLCVRAFRDDFGKLLPPVVEQQLLTARQTMQPLFLQTSLQELRLGAARHELSERVAEHLSAKDVSELFERMLARFERSYDIDRPHLVCESLGLLWAARRGLRESELRELLGRPGEALAAHLWAPLITALRPHLVPREGLIAFHGEAIRDAVARCYLGSREDRLAASAALADYFARQSLEPRAIEELPWQLLWSARIDELAVLLTNAVFLPAACKHDPEDLLQLARSIEAGGLRIAAIFA